MLSSLSRYQKRLIYLLSDIMIVLISLYAAFCLRFGSAFPFSQTEFPWALWGVVAFIAPFVFMVLRMPYIKLSGFDATAFMRIACAGIVLAGCIMVVSYLFHLGPPRSVPIIFSVVFIGFACLSRNLAQLTIYHRSNGVGVAIYGAGDAGLQLAMGLRQSREVEPVIFIDDNPALHGMLVAGLKVSGPMVLNDMIASGQVQRILVAMPSLPVAKRDALLARISDLKCDIQVLPSYVDLISGKVSELRTVSPDELLGRDKVVLDIPEIAETYSGRTVMVTGAGGSIGSELCRQLIECSPARVVLFEQSEFALYEIDREMRQMAQIAGIDITTRLGSVTNAARVANVMADENVEIVLHAAAYKHVPLVEDNELEGAQNNVIGTRIVAQAAIEQGVERFILVSTDKAVRPTNIMGATKRMAELVIQDLQSRSKVTRFAMVRFGNVLGSSGSVLPLFQKQIRLGGPVTVTHKDVTRFFMTIPEAARLVLLAGSYATGGDVFVLDMGQPMKIIDIAKRMIEMSGAYVRSDTHPDGIELQITGMRPGEKLYEELLIDDDSLVATPHEKILRAEEAMLCCADVSAMLVDLQNALSQGNKAALRKCIVEFVQGYHTPELSA